MFCALFRLPDVEQGYNYIHSLYIVILCAPNLPSDLCLSGEDLHGPPPVSRVLYLAQRYCVLRRCVLFWALVSCGAKLASKHFVEAESRMVSLLVRHTKRTLRCCK